MSQVTRVVRQWLEMEAAFGMSEVPVRRVKPRTPRGDRAPIAAKRPPGREIADYAEELRQPRRASTLPSVPVVSRPQPGGPAAASSPAGYPARSASVPAPAKPAGLIPGVTPMAGKTVAKKAAVSIPPTPTGAIGDTPALTREQKVAALEALQAEVEASSEPWINDISTRVVFGEGDPDAPIMFVGEGPGAEEDRTGRPFVGRSGALLDKMIAAIGYQRQQVYIANVVKLRAADWDPASRRLKDRPPNPEEVARGIAFLHRQIEIIRPNVIVTLGAPAVKHLVGVTEGVTKIRGKWLLYRGVPVMPTYHPSFVLRAYTPENRRKVWEDLKEAARRATGS